mgnify:CR=1 FL=1
MYQTKCVISIHVYIYLVLDESYIPCKYIKISFSIFNIKNDWDT